MGPTATGVMEMIPMHSAWTLPAHRSESDNGFGARFSR